MLSLKASKSPRPCGSQKTELNIAGLESSDYNRPFICPIWIHLKSPPIYSLSVLCNQLQNFHFTRQNFFWHSVKPAYQAQFFFFFSLGITLKRGHASEFLSSSHSVPMPTQAVSSHVSSACVSTHLSRKRVESHKALKEIYQNVHVSWAWSVR